MKINGTVLCRYLFMLVSTSSLVAAPTSQPAEQGATLYVSKLGDNSDGSSWHKAFTSLQGALSAVPAGGGHRVIVRPDTYVEANLYPAHTGEAGAYNALTGDFDGRLGSGASGWVIIDASCPDQVVRTDPKGKGGNPGFVVLKDGGPEGGLKSIDWWCPFASSPDRSGACWDRWRFEHLYATGAESGIGWDMTTRPGAEFSAIVEDCVGVGRFAGACIMGHVARPAEPVVFRRSYFACLDWWGDAGAAYVRAEHDRMPAESDAVFEDCTLVSPDNALECGYPGFKGFTRVRFTNCRLIVTNFSQPVGTPGTGIIHTPLDGRQLHVDLEDCTLMGYQVFGVGSGKIGYTTKGAVRAYTQFRQPPPSGFEHLGLWPVDIFRRIAPPERPSGLVSTDSNVAAGPLVKEDRIISEVCEAAPIVWKGRLVLMECMRPVDAGRPEQFYLSLRDVETGDILGRFAEGYGLASVLVAGDTLHAFASRRGPDGSWNDVTHFSSQDLRHWDHGVAIQQQGEHLFNSSVCATDDGYVMAYETDDSRYVPFTVKFARSRDLKTWEKVEGAIFGADRYAACPCIRYAGGRFYLMYLEHKTPQWRFETYLARSRDLKTWEPSPLNPLIAPEAGEGENTSDPDVAEVAGRTYLYYSIGDQRTWAKLKRATYGGSMQEFFESRFH
jgi:hypothetical protein